MKIDLHRAVLAALMVTILAGCTFAAPLGSPGPSGADGSGAPAATDGTDTPDATPTPRPGKTATPDSTPTRKPAKTAVPTATRTPRPAATAQADIPGLDGLLGTDGRFTMLLMGVDSRSKQLGGRTDTIMFVTINPKTGKVAMASVPRDMVLVPIGPGQTFGSKYTRINALFSSLSATNGGKQKAFKKMVQAMEYMSGIEIDRYAMIGFRGVRNLVNAVGGVDVKLDRPLVDKTMHVVMKGREGLVLKAGKNHLNGDVALAFARTRHTDTDYERGRRQQQLIVAALSKVLKRGPAALPGLLSNMQGLIKTDVDFGDAPGLLALAQRAKLGSWKSTILGPSKYAGPGDMLYATKLKMDVVRAYFQSQFGPVR